MELLAWADWVVVHGLVLALVLAMKLSLVSRHSGPDSSSIACGELRDYRSEGNDYEYDNGSMDIDMEELDKASHDVGSDAHNDSKIDDKHEESYLEEQEWP
ncbi:hypothetical protein AC579_3966 [Pseudocercospora musae]|uniref:Uncharacterized protein n=1 Tax=Pseudocercospora musae TaxID=113226 RepID=A0A139I1S9_9PEZI|nr:hypothetical protein AC579_3966 [Pseudocercospora musae]